MNCVQYLPRAKQTNWLGAFVQVGIDACQELFRNLPLRALTGRHSVKMERFVLSGAQEL